MKKRILYFLAGVGITACIALIWAFKSPVDQPGSYAAVNFMKGADRYAVFAYSEGNPEELKYDKGTPDPQVILQITAKLEAKGYSLQNYAVDQAGFYFIFKKKQ